MRMKRVATAITAGCAAIVISTASGLDAQTPQAPHHQATTKAKPSADMEAKCQAMMAERDKMMADMKAADQRLDELVATMNAASGTDKATATAAVVTEMVTERRTMREGMMTMQHDMMGHMMEHVQAGKDSMAMCPMMKMGDMKH